VWTSSGRRNARADTHECTHVQHLEIKKYASPLMRMPSDAATPVPTITAVGVAKPRAQGQAMTMTLMPNRRAKRKGVWPSGSQVAGKSSHVPAMYLQSNRREVWYVPACYVLCTCRIWNKVPCVPAMYLQRKVRGVWNDRCGRL